MMRISTCDGWVDRLVRMIQRIVGFTFDLTGIGIDQGDLDLDLGYGRE